MSERDNLAEQAGPEVDRQEMTEPEDAAISSEEPAPFETDRSAEPDTLSDQSVSPDGVPKCPNLGESEGSSEAAEDGDPGDIVVPVMVQPGGTVSKEPPSSLSEVDDAAAISRDDVPTEEVSESEVCDDEATCEASVLAEVEDSVDLSALLKAMQQGFSQLQAAFDARLRYDGAKEEIIDRLHCEVQEYKADMALRIFKPIVSDLINLYDDMGKMQDHWKTKAVDNELATRLLRMFGEFRLDIEGILEKYGFPSFENIGLDFEPRCQRIMKKVVTNDQAKHRTLAARVRKGFMHGDQVFRPEFVNVFVYNKPTA